MKLNCKVGDLAVLVRSKSCPQLIGSVVRCISFEDSFDIPGWVVEPQIDTYWCIADRLLRPIRDQSGDDETLSWCDVPNEVAE